MSKKKEVVWEDGLQMLGVPIGVESDTANNFHFQIQTEMVIEMTNNATQTIIGAFKKGDTKKVEQMVRFYEDLKSDFRTGVERGFLKGEDVEKMCSVVDEIIANPLSAIVEDTPLPN